MSKLIGHVGKDRTADNSAVHVLASVGGVEMHSDEMFTLEPTDARAYAAFLEVAADEVDRMRRPFPSAPITQATDAYARAVHAWRRALHAHDHSTEPSKSEEILEIQRILRDKAARELADLIIAPESERT